MKYEKTEYTEHVILFAVLLFNGGKKNHRKKMKRTLECFSFVQNVELTQASR